MPRKATPLTANDIKTKTAPGMYADGNGLYLRIGPGGAKSWVFRYRAEGKLRDMGLGSIDRWNLYEARQRAKKLAQARDEGIDPIDARRAARDAARLEAASRRTFRQCAEEFLSERTFRNDKHAAQWPSSLATYAYPTLGDLPIGGIETPHVLDALKPIWNTKTETASRVRQRIEAVLGWATVHGYRQGDNPARWTNHLDKALPSPTKAKEAVRRTAGRGEHHAALAYRDLASFVRILRDQPGVAARALEFAILTCARTGEVIGARWDEIDLDERLWMIPAERMKASRSHRVPLADAAMAILSEMAAIRSSDFVFPGGAAKRPLSNMAMLALLRRMGRDDLTVHGFRSTFSDWCAEQTAFPSEVREMALAHAVGDKVEAAYRRGDLFDKRRQLAEAWARYATGDDAAEVVRLRPAG